MTFCKKKDNYILYQSCFYSKDYGIDGAKPRFGENYIDAPKMRNKDKIKQSIFQYSDIYVGLLYIASSKDIDVNLFKKLNAKTFAICGAINKSQILEILPF